MTWLGWQIDYLLLLQNFRELTHGILDPFFLFISQLGIMPFTAIAICIIYWGINKKLGLYIIYCSCFSFLMNMLLKFTFCIYRPWLLDSRIHPVSGALPTATGYSFPSGHTAGAMSFWGAIGAFYRKKKWVLYSCLIIVFLIMLSRNYLGVHTSQDVIVSFLVGIFIIFIVEKMINTIENKKNTDIICLIINLCLCALIGAYLILKSYPADYINGAIVYDPTSAKLEALSMIFYVSALFTGGFLERRFINFEPQKGSILRKIILVTIGLVLMFSIDILLKKIFLSVTDAQILKYIIRFTTGFFIVFLYPCFIKLTDKICSKN